MELTNAYFKAEQNYLTPVDSIEQDNTESLKDMIYELENALDVLYEAGEAAEDMEAELEELKIRLMYC